jgi:hypothetical protein
MFGYNKSEFIGRDIETLSSGVHLCLLQNSERSRKSRDFSRHRHTVARASRELELVALRHQVTVLRWQRPGQLRLFSTDRLLTEFDVPYVAERAFKA